MPLRRGGFGGGSLDPFGSGGGNLGRYNLGASIQSLAELEAYEVAVGWQNGTVTDDEYLASLQKMVDLAPKGTRERVTAENKLADAKYAIGRNKLVRQVNLADSSAERIAALKALESFDRTRLGTMTVDNEQYRETQDRISSSQADIRQTTYGDIVERYNRGNASTADLISYVRSAISAAAGQADEDDWTKTLGELVDRQSDEVLADAIQDYQHHRKTGAQLLAILDARLSQLQPGSPRYKELARQREDLADQVHDQAQQLKLAEIYKAKNAGQISDNAYIAALAADVAEQEPGTSARVEAENRLRQATYSLAEDRLRYDVSVNKAGAVSRLIAFYRSYQATMNPGSAEWRGIDLAIRQLGARGGGGGGGGGGGTAAGFANTMPAKMVSGAADINWLLAQKGTPAEVAGLFTLNPANAGDADWFDNNRRSMVASYQRGDQTWTYFGKDGRTYTLDFTPSMLETMDRQNISYMQALVVGAEDYKHRQAAIGKLITAATQARDRGVQISMDQYELLTGAIQGEKERALAAGRIADYINLTFAQENAIRGMLMLPDGVPVDVGLNRNPLLTAAALKRLGSDIDVLEPLGADPTDPNTWNAKGDRIMALLRDGKLAVEDTNGDGLIDKASIDPKYGYVTQAANGTTSFELIDGNPDAYYTREDGTLAPRYMQDHVQVRINQNGEDAIYWQPVIGGAGAAGTSGPDGIVSVPIRVVDTYGYDAGAAIGITPNLPMQGGVLTPSSGVSVGWQTRLSGASMPLPGVQVVEHHAGLPDRVIYWITLDGINFIRMNAEPGSKPPQVVANRDSGATVRDGQLYVGGQLWSDYQKQNPTAQLGSFFHWYGEGYVDASGNYQNPDWQGHGQANVGTGAPGTFYEIRTMGRNGELDVRPDYIRAATEANPATLFTLKRTGETAGGADRTLYAAKQQADREATATIKTTAVRHDDYLRTRLGEAPAPKPRPGGSLNPLNRDMDKGLRTELMPNTRFLVPQPPSTPKLTQVGKGYAPAITATTPLPPIQTVVAAVAPVTVPTLKPPPPLTVQQQANRVGEPVKPKPKPTPKPAPKPTYDPNTGHYVVGRD